MFELTCICLALLAITVLLKHTVIAITDAPIQEPHHAIPPTPTTANIDVEFASFLERVAAFSAATSPAEISSTSAIPVGEATSPECFVVIDDRLQQPRQRVNRSRRQPNRVISHTGRYNVRFCPHRAGKTKARKVATEIVSEVDTLHAALHRLRGQWESFHYAANDILVATAAAGTVQNTVANKASTRVNGITMGDISAEAVPIIEGTATSHTTGSARGIAVPAIATVEAVSTVNAITTLDTVSSIAAANAVKPITVFEAIITGNVFKIFKAVRAVAVTKIVEPSNTLKPITSGDSTNTVESVNCINAINTRKEFITGIRGAVEGAGSQHVFPLGLSMDSDEDKALPDIDCHAIEKTPGTINKDSSGMHVAADFKAHANTNNVAADRGESMQPVKKHITTSQKVSNRGVQIVSSPVSVVSPPEHVVTPSLGLSPGVAGRTLTKESIPHTSNTPSVRANPGTPPRTPPGVGFLDCGVQTEASSLHITASNVRQESIADISFLGANPLTPPSSPTLLGSINGGVQTKATKKKRVNSPPTPQHTSGLIKPLIELPNTRTPPTTPGATDDDVRMWGLGCSPAFNPDHHKAQMACDAFEEQWLNRRLGTSIDKWQSSKWWTPEKRKTRTFNWGMRRTINPEVKAHIYEIPEDVSFAVDDELDLPYSEEGWEARRVEIKASLGVYEL